MDMQDRTKQTIEQQLRWIQVELDKLNAEKVALEMELAQIQE